MNTATPAADWKVTRNCCTSGNCFDCYPMRGPLKVTHADKLSEKRAREIAANWHTYKAVAEPMPGSAPSGEVCGSVAHCGQRSTAPG